MNKLSSILTVAFTVFSLTCHAQKTFTFGTNTNPDGVKFEVDSRGFIVGGQHLLPVMGEIHYARVPEKDWRREIRKMKAGGITVISTYVFWAHHEDKEGVFDWSGNRNLHRFLQVCGEENMPVVVRIGPFCHGEVYLGGIPEWIVKKSIENPKEYKIRSLAPGFMAAVERLYANIFAQVSGLQWKDGGPVVGVQLENECRGPWAYYMALKNTAVKLGFDTPFYTRTGWPKLNGKEEFGQMLPLYGDYADGFWDRTLDDMPGDYPKAFVMKDTRLSANIATETFGTNQDTKMNASDLQYPYLTCELGGGMMMAYHRRINMSGNEPFPLAVCKVGSGSNLPGYYMYHGGTNPTHPAHSMAELQNSLVTNYNDMPYISYDFQSPLGEMGQLNENAYHQTRLFHQFLNDWGGELSQMDVDTLSEHYAKRGCFEFYNDYVRILNENGRSYVRPVDMDFMGHKITADAQPFAKIGSTLYFIPIKNMKPVIWVDGKKFSMKWEKMVTFKGKDGKADISFCVLSNEIARTAFVIDGEMHYAKQEGILYKGDNGVIVEETWNELPLTVTYQMTQQAGPARDIKMGKQKVAEMPVAADFDAAAVYSITIPEGIDAENTFLRINYEADCARVFADGKLVEDNFWNGKPMLVRMSELAGKKVELRILPLRKDAPIYLQKAQKAVLDAAEGSTLLHVSGMSVIERSTKPL